MHRIGLRRALPLAFTLIHVVLVWFSLAHELHAARIVFLGSGYRSVAYQEALGGVPMETFGEPPPLKPVQKIAFVLELPAVLFAVLIGAVLFPRNETAWLYTSIPLVPLLWYVIGRWLDGLLGYSTRLSLPAILRVSVAVPAVGVLCVSLAGITSLNHHRTADTYWVLTSSMLWSSLCITMMTTTARRNR
jgi:hypothetical protein